MLVGSYVLIAYFTVHCQAFSPSVVDRLTITRGIHDQFTNGNCQENCNCNNLHARCVDGSCLICTCDGSYQTFNPQEGRCVKNEEFAFSVVDCHSFLTHEMEYNRCMYPSDDTPYVTAGFLCDVTNTKQHWIWTRKSQLLNLFTLKCLGMSDVTSEIKYIGKYPRVSLNFCNVSDSRQLWKCGDSMKTLFSPRNNNKLYLNFGNTGHYIILFTGTGTFSQWRRYQSSSLSESICSHVSSYDGCYRYSDGSTIWTLDKKDLDDCLLNNSNKQQCVKEKDIQAPIEITNHRCFVQWNAAQFLNYTVWHQLPFTDTSDIFSIRKIQIGILRLNIDLNKISTKWLGQIIKLFVRCVSDRALGPGAISSSVQTTNETHCVLIKFSGEFETLYKVYETSTATTSDKPVISTGEDRNATKSSTNSESSSSTIVIVVVICFIVVFLMVAGIGYWFYRKKRGQSKTDSSARTKKKKSGKVPTASEAESFNPLYSPEGIHPRDSNETYQQPIVGAESECGLYEPDVEHVYHYVDQRTGSRGTNEVRLQSQPNIYDYATNDDVSLKPQQLLSHYENSEVNNN